MNKFKCIKDKPHAWFLLSVFVVLNLANTNSQAAAIHDAAKSGELDQIQHLVSRVWM